MSDCDPVVIMKLYACDSYQGIPSNEEVHQQITFFESKGNEHTSKKAVVANPVPSAWRDRDRESSATSTILPKSLSEVESEMSLNNKTAKTDSVLNESNTSDLPATVIPVLSRPVHFEKGSFRGNLSLVKRNVSEEGDATICVFVKGWLEDTLWPIPDNDFDDRLNLYMKEEGQSTMKEPSNEFFSKQNTNDKSEQKRNFDPFGEKLLKTEKMEEIETNSKIYMNESQTTENSDKDEIDNRMLRKQEKRERKENASKKKLLNEKSLNCSSSSTDVMSQCTKDRCQIPNLIDVALIDVDLKSAAETAISALYPRLTPGGIILSQDCHLLSHVELLSSSSFWDPIVDTCKQRHLKTYHSLTSASVEHFEKKISKENSCGGNPKNSLHVEAINDDDMKVEQNIRESLLVNLNFYPIIDGLRKRKFVEMRKPLNIESASSKGI
eukprot:MONOS_14424.1-p1 / transcript=MONOS_14424.1 / gene=MONOS_14424 / organism=Monocercomonoides_exilis_PA203 / gene_product=unspecified product / transcript_product=unspecified product / location=Mono_scaffold00998:18642-20076(+) / protein_length=439 / sequence_SO=supercontig / SO=protein_coding / is_pseudo=false